MLKNKCCLYVIISIRFFSITICNLLIESPSYILGFFALQHPVLSTGPNVLRRTFLSKDLRRFWPKHQPLHQCHGKIHKQKPRNWVYIMNELFSLLSWRHFKKSQKHHQANKIWVSVIELTDIGSSYVADVIVSTRLADFSGDIFLLHSEVLDMVTHTIIPILSDNAVKVLWKAEV